MGLTLKSYPPAGAALRAFVGHAGRLGPSLMRYFVVAQLARYLTRAADDEHGWPPG
ncbi:hypothetical protein SAMN05444320_105398 [Streptoalloteichus hindustanus]|uniref:Uncharacterized protein n=2 Tax=Streptoalloteichus hindustanus TaxID=2017 RepID=A0A1M5FF21_STRHI|nr:hypothetical protein SAMN05444320_105398 [Streptoalloteichus hindustanus]